MIYVGSTPEPVLQAFERLATEFEALADRYATLTAPVGLIAASDSARSNGSTLPSRRTCTTQICAARDRLLWARRAGDAMRAAARVLERVHPDR
jgi:hypothetical protein